MCSGGVSNLSISRSSILTHFDVILRICAPGVPTPLSPLLLFAFALLDAKLLNNDGVISLSASLSLLLLLSTRLFISSLRTACLRADSRDCSAASFLTATNRATSLPGKFSQSPADTSAESPDGQTASRNTPKVSVCITAKENLALANSAPKKILHTSTARV